ncbi:MAG: helix-turn-helix transcriptional regulator [Oscillospiraceae bacterium]|nr:helix-turn-helix transcriptional regulator [Oscillospiraceae bacterium]
MPLETTDSLNQSLTRNLRLIYRARRTTLEEFSCELGIGHSTLRNILRGQGNSTLGTVEQIAQNLGIAPQVLLTNQNTEECLLSALLLLEAVGCLRPLDPGQKRQTALLLSQLLELLPPTGPRSRLSE